MNVKRLALLTLSAAVVVSTGCSLDLTVPENPARGGVKGQLDTGGHASAEGIAVQLISSAGTKSPPQLTNATGAFSFDDLAPGPYFLEVRREGFAPLIVPAVTVTKGSVTDVGVIALTWLAGTAAEATLIGKVVAEGGGVPENARVELVLQASMQKIAATSVGPDGLFTVRVPPGTYLLHASHPLYVTTDRRDVAVPEGVTTDLTSAPLSLPLNPATLSGRVLSETDGEAGAQPQAMVLVTLDSGQTTTTDVQGQYTFQGLPGGARTARFSLMNHVDGEARAALKPGESTTLPDVVLNLRRGVIQGTIILNDLQPVQDVTVSLTGTAYSALASADPAQAGHGTFRISGVPNGTYEVAASRARYSRAVQSSVQLTDSTPLVTVGPLTLTILVGDFRIDDGDSSNADGYSRRTSVTLGLAAFAGAEEYRASEDPTFATAAWLPFTGTTQPFTLDAAQGSHAVYAQYRRQGVISPTFSSSVILDSVSPTTASVVINGGEAFTNQGQALSLRLVAVDPPPPSGSAAGLGSVRLSLSNATSSVDAGVVLAATPVAYARDTSFAVPQPVVDGPMTVYAQFIDNAGNVSAIVSSSITLDRLEPAHTSLAIRDGALATAAGFTNNPFVVLDHSADAEPAGGFVRIKLSNSSASLAAAVYQPLATTSSWFLDPSGPELKTVFARFIDAAGNETSVVQAQITYDLTPPSPVTVTLLSGSPTSDAGITLSVAAADTNGLSPTVALAVSEDPLFTRDVSGPMAMPVGGVTTYRLVPGDGTHQVLVRVTDKAGNSSSASVSVALDTLAPSGARLSLGTGEPIQTGTTFTAVFDNLDSDVTRMAIVASSTAPDCASVTYSAYVPNTAVPLSDGPRTVYACLKDAAGNTARYGPATVIVDNAVPTVSSIALTGLSNQAASVTKDFALSVVFAGIADSAAGVDSLRVSTDPTFAGSSFVQANAGAIVTGALTFPFTLPPGDGLKTVYAQVRDRAGFVSAPVQATVTLDTQAPTWSQTVATSLYVSAATGAFTLAAIDNIDAQSQLSVGGAFTATGCASAVLQAFSASFSFGPLADGANDVFLCLQDRAGNRPAVPPGLRIHRIANPPLAANLAPNPPIALASGALISWTDSNAFTRVIEVDASLDPTFTTGVRTYQAAVGSCTEGGVTPPTSSARIGVSTGDLPLTNLRNWYFQLRAIDCAGATSSNVRIFDPEGNQRSVVPNLGPTPITETLVGGQVISDGADLWEHAYESNNVGTRYERVRHCKAGVVDCRDASNWSSTLVRMFNSPTSGYGTSATMFTTDSALFIVEAVYATSSGWLLAMASCDRATNCDEASNWLTDQTLNTGAAPDNLGSPVGAVSSAALGVFYVTKRSSYGYAPYLTMARCDRSTGNDCRFGNSWKLVETPIRVESGEPITVSASDNQFFIGAVSEGSYGESVQGPTTYGQPMLIKCEGLCSSGGGFVTAGCTGGTGWPATTPPPACNCDGNVCGDFRFSRFTNAIGSEDLRASAPKVVTAGGQKTAVWSERRCIGNDCTDSIRSATCLGTDCQYGGQYSSPGALAQWSTTGSLYLPRSPIGVTTSGSQAVNEVLRVAYTNQNTHAGWLSSCSTQLFSPCFSPAGTTSAKVTADGETLSGPAAAIGRNVYLMGARALGERVLWQPIVPTPSQFVVGARVGALEASWAASNVSSVTAVTHSLPDGGAPALVQLADPFTSSVTLASTSTRLASVSFRNGNGVGDPAPTWETAPFRSVPAQGGAQGTSASVSLASPGPGGNAFVYSAYVTSTGLSIGRCDSATDCGNPSSWVWGPIDTGGFDSVQLAVDYPRHYSNMSGAGRISATTPRLFMTATSSGTLYLYGCVLTTPSACSTAIDFTKTALAVTYGATPTLQVVGDRVQVTEPIFGTQNVMVRTCDGSRSGTHDTCASGNAATDRPLSYCFNAVNWQHVSISGNQFGATYFSAVTGAPHPTYGYMMVQPRAAGGFVLWTCAFGTASCSSTQTDCGNTANWVAGLVNTGGSVDNPDITSSFDQYAPTRGMSDQTAGVYVSYYDASGSRWGIAQCKGGARPDFALWNCTLNNGSMSPNQRYLLGWSNTSVLTGVQGTPASSTIRSIDGDLVASYSMLDRTYLAKCSGGFDCIRKPSWSVYSPGTSTNVSSSRSTLAGGVNGDLFLMFGQPGGATLLSGGKFSAR